MKYGASQRALAGWFEHLDRRPLPESDVRKWQEMAGIPVYGMMSLENVKAIKKWRKKAAMKKKTTKKIYRSAIDGRLVTKVKAQQNPSTTVTETVPIRVGDLLATLGLAHPSRELTPSELKAARALVAELNPAGPTKVSRSARSGEFVTRATAKRSPSTTTTERVRRPKRK